MRESGVRGVLIYRADYSIALSAKPRNAGGLLAARTPGSS
jgi:hypothetical protein